MKNITVPNLIKVIFYFNICTGIRCEQAKEAAICHSVPKTFDFSQNSSVPFHQVTFYRSISCVLLIEKPGESCRNCMKFYFIPHKKAFKNQRKKYYTSKDKCLNFTNFFRTPKSNNSELS